MQKKTHQEIDDLAEKAQKGDEMAFNDLIRYYDPFIVNLVRKKRYYIQGGDAEDAVQEGRIGLMNSIKYYKKETGNFNNYVWFHIRSQIVQSFVKATAKKHLPLTRAVYFEKKLPSNGSVEGSVEKTYEETASYIHSQREIHTPEDMILLEEKTALIETFQEKSLSSFEKKILEFAQDGKSYIEIAEIMGLDTTKQVDNAIQRARKKAKEMLENYENGKEEKKR